MLNKKINCTLITLFFLSLNACSVNPPLNTGTNDNKEDKFNVKAISPPYLKRKLDKLVNTGRGAKVLNEVSFAQKKHPALMKTVTDENPGILRAILNFPEIQAKTGNDPNFADFIKTLIPASEKQVNVTTAGEQSNPGIAMDNSGNYVIVWQSNLQDGSGLGIYAQRYASNGMPRGQEFLVNTITANDQRDPAIAMTSTGDFVISWSGYTDPGEWEVYARKFNNQGIAQAPEFKVNTYIQSYQAASSVGMDDSGNFVIAWQSYWQDGDGYSINAQKFYANCSPNGGEFQVNTYTPNFQTNPSVAMSNNGNFIISWESDVQDGNRSGIYGRLYTNQGGTIGPEFLVNTFTTQIQALPAAAMDADGDFVIAWSSHTQDGSGWGIYAQRYDKTGTASGIESMINTTTTGHQEFLAAAMDDNGNYTISWTGPDSASSNGLFAQKFAADGSMVDTEFPVNTFTSGEQINPAIAMNSSGRFVIGWQSNLQDGSDQGVFALNF